MTACVRRSCKSLPLNRRVQPLTKSRDWCSHALPQGQGTPCPCPCVNTRCSEYRTFAPGAHMWSSGNAAAQRHEGRSPDRDAGGSRELGRGAGNPRRCSRNAQGSAKPLTSRVPCASSFAIVIGGWEHLTDVVPFWGRCGAERGQLRGTSTSINPRF